MYLKQLEGFFAAAGGSGGKFTASGTTVGECKLFTTLHTLVMIKPDVLAGFGGLEAFHARFLAEKVTADLIASGGKMARPFAQYFMA